jgi:CHAT domain-containing protein
MGIIGCAGIQKYMPAPPDLITKVELKNTYDGDIPKKLVRQIKWASIFSDWATPYIYINIAAHFESVGDELRAIHFYDRAINEAGKRNDVYGEGTITNKKLLAMYKFGKKQDAYNIIVEKERTWSKSFLNIFAMQSYANYYLMSGEYDKAIKYFRQSLDFNNNYQSNFNLLMLRRDNEMNYGIAIILADYIPALFARLKSLDFDESFIREIRKNIDEGISCLNHVTILNKEISKSKIGQYTSDIVFQTMESNVNNYLGLAYGIKGLIPEAVEKLSASAKLSRKIYYPIGEIKSIFFHNQIYLLEKNIAAGQRAALELNELAFKYHLPFYQIWSKLILSYYKAKIGNNSQAIDLLEEAIAIMENRYPEFPADMIQEAYLLDKEALYKELTELLIEEGDYTGAWAAAEREKSSQMVALLTGEDIGKNKIETELIGNIKTNYKEMTDGYKKMYGVFADYKALKETMKQIEKSENGRLDAIKKIKEQNEELSSLVSVEPLDTDNLQQLLDKNTTVFSYYVTDKILYIWAITKDKIHLEKIKIAREEVAKMVSSFVAAILAKDKKQTESLSEKIYSILLKPVIPFVSGDRIGVIPHGPLYWLPFAAISSKEQYLVDGFSIFYLPNAGMIKYVLKKQMTQEMKVLAFANPDLDEKQLELSYTKAEVENIEKNIPQTTIFQGNEATKAKVKENISNYDVVHFAIPGIYEKSVPVKSGLMFTSAHPDDRRLTAGEIFKLKFKGRAILMSSCHVLSELSLNGAEIATLNTSFVYAGSPSVVSTIWNIEDKSRVNFMDIFYSNLKKDESIADSLRTTQNEMIKLGYQPYDWAAFILTGKY